MYVHLCWGTFCGSLEMRQCPNGGHPFVRLFAHPTDNSSIYYITIYQLFVAFIRLSVRPFAGIGKHKYALFD